MRPFRAVRGVTRFTDIILVLIKYGFDDIVDRLHPRKKDILRRRVQRVGGNLTSPERLRLMLEELGTTFIKLGQIAGVRPDLIPEQYARELVKLQDQVAPVEFSRIREEVKKGLGAEMEEVFSFFDENPIASASVAQVHRAALKKSGQGVVVKVRRPGIESKVRSDLEIMEVFARNLDKLTPELRQVDLPALVAEFKVTLLNELDFRKEARNIKIFHHNFEHTPDVFAPIVYEHYSSASVLTLEYIKGVSVNAFSGTDEQRETLARLGIEATVKQILVDGFFHADPHSSNMVIVDGAKICFLDWGMAGRASRRNRYDILDVILAFVRQDEEELLDSWLRLCNADIEQTGSLERGILEILDNFNTRQESERSLGRFMLEMINLFRRSRATVPPYLAVMAKAFLEAEGAVRKLYPPINLVEMIRPSIEKIQRERYNPAHLGKELAKQSHDILRELAKLPGDVGRLVEKMRSDRFTVTLEHQDLPQFSHVLDEISKRLAFAIVIGALIIGSSMILVAGIKPLLFGYSLLGIIGFLFSGILGAWMVLSIFRSRNF